MLVDLATKPGPSSLTCRRAKPTDHATASAPPSRPRAQGTLQEVTTVWSRIAAALSSRRTDGTHEDLWLYAPPVTPAGAQQLKVCRPEDRHDFARLEWRACAQCRLGLISQIRVNAAHQGQGYGIRMLLRAVRGYEEYAWSTSRQSAEGRQFFPRASAAAGIEFSRHAYQCDHMRTGSTIPGKARSIPAPR
ncbi:hypothetical protein ABZ502_17405 [Streptomyces abikoensis]|uniref:hypothetical protein n=1 Tax=Streptomyces abikoensis TaxID=97398 RepID=UPI003406BF4F